MLFVTFPHNVEKSLNALTDFLGFRFAEFFDKPFICFATAFTAITPALPVGGEVAA